MKSVCDLQAFGSRVDHRLPPCSRHSLRSGPVGQALRHREVVIKAKEIRQKPHTAVRTARIFMNIEPVQIDRPREWLVEGGANAHQRRLAGAVWTDQGRDRANPKLERNVIQSAVARIIENQVFNAQHASSLAAFDPDGKALGSPPGVWIFRYGSKGKVMFHDRRTSHFTLDDRSVTIR